MADVVSEVREDGSSEVVETAQTSNYEMSLNRLDGQLPEAPPLDALSKIYKPRYVLEVTAPDGTVIPFVYKRIDPATLMLTQGSPVVITPEDRSKATELEQKSKELYADIRSTDDVNVRQEKLDELQTLMSDPRTQELNIMGEQIRKRVIQSGVISPEITDEIYENLDDSILDALHEAITGGVTNQNELVEHFRGDVEGAEVS